MIPPNDDFERRLRAALDAHARQAPPGAPLADRVLLEIDAPVLRPRRGWRTWSAPLLAAAAIVAAAVALVGVGNAHLGAPPAPAATHQLSTAPVPRVSATPPRPAPSTSPTPAPASTSSARVADTGGVHGFRAVDITYDSATEGWALGSATCLTGSGRCTEILHTTDGTNWLPAPKGENFDVPGVNDCKKPCVAHLRFANATTGYAYGPQALFMTTDGGAHWVRQNGLGADVLETLDNNVILVRAINAPSILLRRAAVGSDQWSAFTVPGVVANGAADGVQLVRAHGVALLTSITYHPAEGGENSGALYRSTDGGATWQRLSRPCGIQPTGYYSTITAATVAGDGSAALGCAVYTTKDLTGFGDTVSARPGTTKFTRPAAGEKLTPASLIASPSHSVQLVVEPSGRVYRSDDTGNTWTPVPQLRDVTFIGFESGSVGRALGDNGRAIWTTSDAGATWSELLFPA